MSVVGQCGSATNKSYRGAVRQSQRSEFVTCDEHPLLLGESIQGHFPRSADQQSPWTKAMHRDLAFLERVVQRIVAHPVA